MKQYQIVKYLYADSIRQAIEREKEGIIISTFLSDDFDKEDFDRINESKKKLKANLNHEKI